MQRRQILRLAGACAAGSTVALPLFAQAAADSWLAHLQRAKATQPWILGYRIPAGDFAGASAQVSGRFPPAVKGVLFRNGPAMHDMDGLRYQHWFDGDGMVQRCAITATGVTHRGKVVRTPMFVPEQATGHERALEPYDLAAVEREAARIRPLDAAAESSSSPCARSSWSATLPTMQRCTRRWPHSTSCA